MFASAIIQSLGGNVDTVSIISTNYHNVLLYSALALSVLFIVISIFMIVTKDDYFKIDIKVNNKKSIITFLNLNIKDSIKDELLKKLSKDRSDEFEIYG